MAQPGRICQTGQQHRSFWQLRRRHNARSWDEELFDVARKAILNQRASRAVIRGADVERVQHHQPGHSEYSDYILVLWTYYQYTIRRAGGSSNNPDDAAAGFLTKFHSLVTARASLRAARPPRKTRGPAPPTQVLWRDRPRYGV